MLTNLPTWLWPIVGFAGLGASIDFLIGRSGQNRARAFLEDWWIRFDDVRWHNFGEREALFAVELIDRYCGKRFYAVRRLASVFFILLLLLIFGYIIALSNTEGNNNFIRELSAVFAFYLFSGVGVAASLSFTRIVSIVVSRIAGYQKYNFYIFVVLCIINYGLLVLWFPLMLIFSTSIHLFIYGILEYYSNMSVSLNSFGAVLNYAFGDMFDRFYEQLGYIRLRPDLFWMDIYHRAIPGKEFRHDLYNLTFYAAYWARILSGCVANLIRLVISIIFLGSFLVKPLLMRPMSLVWLRIVESDKPIFTLVFGAIAGGATAVDQLIGSYLRTLAR